MSATRRQRVLSLVGVIVALAALVVGIRMKQVHDYGWEWTLFPSSAPPKIEYDGRDYQRGQEAVGDVPAGYVRDGETLGQGAIYRSGAGHTSTVLFVKAHGRVYAYGLMGGP